MICKLNRRSSSIDFAVLVAFGFATFFKIAARFGTVASSMLMRRVFEERLAPEPRLLLGTSARRTHRHLRDGQVRPARGMAPSVRRVVPVREERRPRTLPLARTRAHTVHPKAAARSRRHEKKLGSDVSVSLMRS